MKRALWALSLLATAWGASVAVLHFSGGGYERVFALLAGIPARAWAMLGLLTAAFYLLDYVRFYSVLRILGHRITPGFGFKLTCVSYFVSSLTPVAELHTPAMAFLLSRRGIPVSAGVAASLAKSTYMTLWICLLSYFSLLFDSGVRLPPSIAPRVGWLMLPVLLFGAFLAAVAFFPAGLHRGLERRLRDPGLAPWKRKVYAGIDHSALAISRIGRSLDGMHLLCHAASIAFVLVYCAIGWVIARELGLGLTPLRAFAVFSNSLMVAYLSPVPGSVGVTELATSYLIDPAMTSAGMAVALLLRTLCWYAVLVPGGLLLAEAARGRGWSRALRLPREAS